MGAIYCSETSFDFQRTSHHYIPEDTTLCLEWLFYIKSIHSFTVKESPFCDEGGQSMSIRGQSSSGQTNGLFGECPVAGSRIVCSCRRDKGIVGDFHTYWEHSVVAGNLVAVIRGHFVCSNWCRYRLEMITSLLTFCVGCSISLSSFSHWYWQPLRSTDLFVTGSGDRHCFGVAFLRKRAIIFLMDILALRWGKFLF
jgi:hypothetical protein